MHVTSPLRQSVNVNIVYKNCPIVIHDREFSTDLILGMDWLSKHWALIDYDKKTVVLSYFDQSEVIVHGVCSVPMSNVISTMQARRFMRKGCEAFLALVLDSKRVQIELENILAVREFSNVFLEELSGIPLEREVDLFIDILPGPISRAPYRMAPTKLKEIKIKLQELLDKGLIRPSVSPWGAHVLFVKKKR